MQIDKAPLLEIPIYKPDENSKEMQEIIKLVNLISDLTKKLQDIKLDSEKAIIQRQIKVYEEKIDSLIYHVYNLTKENIDIIEESLK